MHKEPTVFLGGNFAGLLRDASRVYGTGEAIRSRDSSATFRDLGARAATVAQALRDAGVQPGDRCGVFLRDPADAAAAFFGVLAVGAVGININELYRPRQLEHVLRNSEARVLISAEDVIRAMPRPLETAAKVLLAPRGLPATSSDLEVHAAEPDAPAQITYTSGSTGQPKGVVMSHGALWAGVRVVAGYLGLRSEDRIASVLPFSFVYGFNQLTTALYTGARLVVERSTLASEIVATLRRERVTVLAAVPPLWQQLLATPAFRDHPLEDLRIMTNAGGRLPVPVVRELRRAQPSARLFLMYGLTEVFRSTYLPPEQVDAHPDSIGRAVPESVVYVVREDGTLAATNEIGELVHGGPTVGEGYYGDAESSARVFRPNPFAASPPRVVFSGDLVRRDEEGWLYHVGRRDRMIKTLGFRVSPDEICDVVMASGQAAECAIVTEPDATRGERIVACVVLREGASLDALARFCRTELPRPMQPARYVPLDAIPRNASGKHDIGVLKSQVAGDSG